MKTFILVTGLVLLFAIEIAKVYFIMPFPGSQKSDSINFAYWIHNNIYWIRMLLILALLFPLISIFRRARVWKKWVMAVVILAYGFIFYMFNFRFLADKMFYQPSTKLFSSGIQNKVEANKLVIAITVNGESKAYPIQLIGYHHQVRDTVGNTPVMVTYCTVCRTGRVYSPLVDGKPENFRLVGMDHFNAMFEDATTKSWWQQATGIAIAGPLKGKALVVIPSEQMSVASWIRRHPNTLVMQPDTTFTKRYEGLKDFDRGTIKSGLEKRDTASWKFKSWVVGIQNGNHSTAYDWNRLVSDKLIQDSMPGLPLMLVIDKDTASYYVYSRQVDGLPLQFALTADGQGFVDGNTGSTWSMDGECIDGPNKGKRLLSVAAHQEFWHSWSTFHRNTLKYMP